jgi:hypothetical protein
VIWFLSLPAPVTPEVAFTGLYDENNGRLALSSAMALLVQTDQVNISLFPLRRHLNISSSVKHGLTLIKIQVAAAP